MSIAPSDAPRPCHSLSVEKNRPFRPLLLIFDCRSEAMRTSLAITLGLCLLVPLAHADKVRIIETTADAAQVRVDLIQQAKRSIDAQYYIVGNDYFTLAGLALLC